MPAAIQRHCVVPCLLLTVLLASPRAQAHAEAGDRLFAGTLTFDDAAVANEISAPLVSWQKIDDTGGTIAKDSAVGGSISRLLTPTLALGVQFDWSRQDETTESTQGLSARHLFLKQQLWRRDESESLGAVVASVGIGGAGNPDLHAHSYNTAEVSLNVAQGMGPAPDPTIITGTGRCLGQYPDHDS
jgi:hypothetical protein